jgi:TRAP-type C4-dicarboxylate transport system substrate-binding protein
MGKEIEKRTKGKVKFKWFLGGTLVKDFQTYDALKNNVVDIAYLAPFNFIDRFPITEGVALPFVVDNALHCADVSWEMYQTMPEMRKEYSEFHMMGLLSTAIMNIATIGPPPKTLDDLQKLRLGVISGPSARMTELLGAGTQSVKIADMYQAIQRKMVDGTVFPDAPLRSFRITELVANHTIGNFIVGPWGVAMAAQTWNKLPPDVKKVFDDLTPSMGMLSAACLDNEAAWVIEELKARGDTFYYLPPEERARWAEKCKPMHEAWIEKLNKKGMDGRAIYNKMMSIAEKWRKNPSQPDAWWGRAGRKTGDGFVPLSEANK